MKIFIIIISSFLLLSCAKEEESESSNSTQNVGEDLSYGENLSFNLSGAQSAIVTT